MVEAQQNIIEDLLYLMDEIKGEVLLRTALFLKNRKIAYGDMLKFIHNPEGYPGKKFKLQQIAIKFLDDAISERYTQIQELNLPINYVRKFVFDLLFKPKQKGENYN